MDQASNRPISDQPEPSDRPVSMREKLLFIESLHSPLPLIGM